MLNADMKMLRQVLILKQNNNFWFVFYIEKKPLYKLYPISRIVFYEGFFIKLIRQHLPDVHFFRKNVLDSYDRYVQVLHLV